MLTCAGALLALLAFAAQAAAEPKNDLTFSVGVLFGGSDNSRGSVRRINGTGIPKEGDFWFGGSVGASYKRRLTFGDLALNAGGSGSLHLSDDRWNQIFGNGSASLRVPITNRLTWTIKDRFSPSPISFADIDTARSNQTQVNDASTGLEFEVPLRGRWSAKLKGSFSRQDIIDVDDVFVGLDPDRYAANGSLSLERKFGSRWSFGVSGYGGRTMFINNAPMFIDTTGYGGSVEASYSVQRNTRFFASIGMGRLTSSRFGSNNLIWSLGVDWQIFKRLGLSIEGRRAHTVLLAGTSAVVSSIKTGLDYTMSTRVGITLTGIWQRTDDASFIPGSDQVFHISPALTYKLGRHIEAALSYGFTRNGSDDVFTNDFTRNSGVLALSAEF